MKITNIGPFLAVSLVSMTPALAWADADADIRQAFDRLARTPQVQVTLKFTKGGATSTVTLQQDGVSRMRMISAGASGREMEVVHIDGTYYRKEATGWAKSRVPTVQEPGKVANQVLAHLLNKVEDVTAQAQRAAGESVYRSTVRWQTGRGLNTGRITFIVLQSTRLPARMRFEGTCSRVPCQFEQVFAYDPSVRVVAPG
jgi:hypothetical protein